MIVVGLLVHALVATGAASPADPSYRSAAEIIHDADRALEQSAFARCPSQVLLEGVWSVDRVLKAADLPPTLSSDARLTRRFLIAMLRSQAYYHLLFGKLALRDGSIVAANAYFRAAHATDPFDPEILAYARVTQFLVSVKIGGSESWQVTNLEESVEYAKAKAFERRFHLAEPSQSESPCPDDTP